MGKTYVTQRGQTKRRATKRGGKGKKNKAVRGMSAALPVAPSPATIVFSAKLALGTQPLLLSPPPHPDYCSFF